MCFKKVVEVLYTIITIYSEIKEQITKFKENNFVWYLTKK